MRAWARHASDRPSKRRIPKRKRITRTAPPPPFPPLPPPSPNIHYEAGWTDSWTHRRCMHKHKTLFELHCAFISTFNQTDFLWTGELFVAR
jgi:hypothetical protein